MVWLVGNGHVFLTILGTFIMDYKITYPLGIIMIHVILEYNLVSSDSLGYLVLT